MTDVQAEFARSILTDLRRKATDDQICAALRAGAAEFGRFFYPDPVNVAQADLEYLHAICHAVARSILPGFVKAEPNLETPSSFHSLKT